MYATKKVIQKVYKNKIILQSQWETIQSTVIQLSIKSILYNIG